MPRGCSDPIMWKRLPVTFRPRKFDVASGSRSGLDDVGPLDTLFGCPKSGLLFGVWEASLDVTASELVDARVFHCPVCDSTLKIGSPGKIPVARCVECDWTTAETGVVSIPDLLTSEVKPYRKANAEFSELRRLAAGLPSLGSELTATGKSELPTMKQRPELNLLREIKRNLIYRCYRHPAPTSYQRVPLYERFVWILCFQGTRCWRLGFTFARTWPHIGSGLILLLFFDLHSPTDPFNL
jgi:hypothetical protein